MSTTNRSPINHRWHIQTDIEKTKPRWKMLYYLGAFEIKQKTVYWRSPERQFFALNSSSASVMYQNDTIRAYEWHRSVVLCLLSLAMRVPPSFVDMATNLLGHSSRLMLLLLLFPRPKPEWKRNGKIYRTIDIHKHTMTLKDCWDFSQIYVFSAMVLCAVCLVPCALYWEAWNINCNVQVSGSLERIRFTYIYLLFREQTDRSKSPTAIYFST